MAKGLPSTKRLLIGKANSTMVVGTTVAAFILVFVLVAAKALMSQASYQNRVISGNKKALTQLQTDLSARDSLVSAYEAFVNTPTNVLGGNPNGTGQQDGNNAKLVLDALPSAYDFPALATTLEKILTSQNLQILGISGTDEELTQGATQSSTTPAPVAMPFQVEVSGSYQSIQSLIAIFQNSIRPFQIQSLQLSGDQSNMTASISAQTYYQPAKGLNITTEVVK